MLRNRPRTECRRWNSPKAMTIDRALTHNVYRVWHTKLAASLVLPTPL